MFPEKIFTAVKTIIVLVFVAMLIAATSEYESIKQQNFSLIQENEQLKIQLLRLQAKGIEP